MTDKEFVKKFPRLDVVALIRGESLPHQFVPEQERNFDAGFMPEATGYEVKCVEWIDGKKYVVYK